MKPTVIPKYFEKYIKMLEGKSRLFGQWNTQLNFAKEALSILGEEKDITN
jgi:hypothetical protein